MIAAGVRLALLRAGGAGAVLALGVGGTALAAHAPAPPAPAAPVRLAVPAATAALSCPGPETLVVPDGARAVPVPGSFTVAIAATGPGAATSQLEPLAAPVGVTAGGQAVVLGAAGVGVREVVAGGRPLHPQRVTSDGAGALLAAAQVTLARAGDLRGLVTGACPTAVTDAWLVGGGTVPGRRGRLLLANPTPAPAVVDVFVSGPSGPVPLPTARGLVVAPGRVRAVLLDALAPGLERLAVHVVARSGRIAPVLHDSYLRGATPAGVDDVVAAAAASRHAVVPGVVLGTSGAGAAPAPVVRVVAPPGADAVVTVHLSGRLGDVPLPAGGVVTVPAGGVADVPLTGVAPGAYAAIVDADVPVLAGAEVVRSGRPAGLLGLAPSDVAWAAATRALSGDAVAAVPRTGAGEKVGLSLAAPLGASVVVREVGARGQRLHQGRVQVPAGSTVVFGLGALTTAVALRADGPAHAALVYELPDPAGALVGVLPVQPSTPAARVEPRVAEDPALGARR
jgi:hypothetical protein